MVSIQGLEINTVILLIGMVGLFAGMIMLTWVNKTVSLSYAFKLFQMKKKKNKNKILLKIFLPNGKPQYQIKDVANIIEYKYKENGREKDGLVKYDYYSMYKDFSDIPILECDPNDIVPRNPFLNTSLAISGQIIKKNIVDSSKEDFSNENLKKWVKAALPIVIAVGVIMILYSQNQTEALQACYQQVAATASQSATIIAG